MKKNRRRGASLLELMVVMAIIVVVAALAFPSLRAMSGSFKLNGGTDSVRSAWANARARAIEEGRPYRFAVEPSGTAFRVAPDDQSYWDGSGGGSSNDPNGRGYVLEKSLPSGVRMTVNGDAALPDESAGADSMEEKPVPQGAQWTPAIVFLPDGTAREDVKVSFRVRGCKPVALVVRAMTGNVTEQTEQ